MIPPLTLFGASRGLLSAAAIMSALRNVHTGLKFPFSRILFVPQLHNVAGAYAALPPGAKVALLNLVGETALIVDSIMSRSGNEEQVKAKLDANGLASELPNGATMYDLGGLLGGIGGIASLLGPILTMTGVGAPIGAALSIGGGLLGGLGGGSKPVSGGQSKGGLFSMFNFDEMDEDPLALTPSTVRYGKGAKRAFLFQQLKEGKEFRTGTTESLKKMQEEAAAAREEAAEMASMQAEQAAQANSELQNQLQTMQMMNMMQGMQQQQAIASIPSSMAINPLGYPQYGEEYAPQNPGGDGSYRDEAMLDTISGYPFVQDHEYDGADEPLIVVGSGQSTPFPARWKAYHDVAEHNGWPTVYDVLADLAQNFEADGQAVTPGEACCEECARAGVPSFFDACKCAAEDADVKYDGESSVAFVAPNNLPRGVFYNSSWFNAELADLPDGTYGMIYTNSKPFRVIINRNVDLPRAQVSWAHEALHALDELYKFNISHGQLHSLAVALVGEVIPGLMAMTRLANESSNQN